MAVSLHNSRFNLWRQPQTVAVSCNFAVKQSQTAATGHVITPKKAHQIGQVVTSEDVSRVDATI